MFRKTLLAVSVGLVSSLSGCGGGGNGGTTPAQITTGTGYYVDSAVKGIKYNCGASEGTTDASGKFTFEIGKGCTFFLGDIKLREIDKAILKDGITVYETDKYTAQVLQSLDSDGNPTNGITISDNFVSALKTAGITTLPTNEAETTAMLAVIESAGGTVVTQTDAQSHAYSTLISGKDLYTVDVEGDNSQNIGPITFKTDGSVVGTEHPTTWRFDGDKLYVGTGSEYHQVMSVTADYILFKNFDADGGTTRAYFDEAKARAFMATLPAPNNQTEMESLIIGKTYYVTVCDTYTENGQTINNDHVETLKFGTDNKLHITWMENNEPKETIHSYSIANEKLTIKGTSEGDVILSLTQVKAFYKTKSTAESKLSTDCSGVQTDLKAILAGKTVYRLDLHNGEKILTTFKFKADMTSMQGFDEARKTTRYI